MKKIILSGLAVLLTLSVSAQEPTWEWAVNGTNTAGDVGQTIAVDNNGNSFVAGNFSGMLTIGSNTLTAIGSSDIFVAKYSPTGQPLWAVRARGNAYGICVDDVGNAYLTGNIYDTADFGTDTFFVDENNATQIYVSKISSEGNFIWTKSWGETGSDVGRNISFNKPNGSLYVTGSFADSVFFDSYALDAGNGTDVFTIKLDTFGGVIWAAQAGSPGVVSAGGGYSVVSDNANNVYVAGTGTTLGMIFGSIATTNTDMFVVRYTNGIAQWAKAIDGSPNMATGIDIATDINGNTYVAGSNHMGSQTFDFGTISVTNSRAFIAKYNSMGVVKWAKSIGDFLHSRLISVSTDEEGNVYLATDFKDTGIFGNDTLVSDGNYDIVIAKLDTNGNYIWVTKVGGTSTEGANDIVASGGSIYATGVINGATNFGSIVLNSSGGQDMFVAKLSQTTGISETFTKNKQLTIYPTPANESVYIKGVQQNTTYRINSLTGSTIQQGNLYKGINRIGIEHFSSGMYLLYAGSEVHKIIKE